MNHSPEFRNILIIKPGAIGDLLQMTPVVRSLKQRFPSADITLIVGSRSTAELFRHNPHVRETIVFDKKGAHRTIRALVALRRYLKEKRYDLVVNFQRSNLKTWFLASAAFPCRVLVYRKTASAPVHAVRNYLETLRPLDADISRTELELAPGPDARSVAETVLGPARKSDSPVVALNPGASHPVNRWPAHHFAALSDLLAREVSATVIVVGGPDDVSLADEIRERAASKPLSLAGKLDLLQLAAVLERCNAVVSGDTGPMHMATAVGTPVIALFGAADPARTGPVGRGHIVLQARDVACVPCRNRRCGNRSGLECMNKLSAKSVFNAVLAVLRKEQQQV